MIKQMSDLDVTTEFLVKTAAEAFATASHAGTVDEMNEADINLEAALIAAGLMHEDEVVDFIYCEQGVDHNSESIHDVTIELSGYGTSGSGRHFTIPCDIDSYRVRFNGVRERLGIGYVNNHRPLMSITTGGIFNQAMGSVKSKLLKAGGLADILQSNEFSDCLDRPDYAPAGSTRRNGRNNPVTSAICIG